MSENLYLKVAGLTIKLVFFPIDNIHLRETFVESVKRDFAGFISKKSSPDTALTIEFREGIDVEIIFRKQEKTYYYETIRFEGKNTVVSYYRIGPALFSFVLKQLLLRVLGDHDCFMLHTSSVLIDGKAFLFMANSGGGKSTIMKFLTHKYQSLADDSVIIRRENSRFYLYQTPMVEKEWWIKKTSDRYEIGGLYFINKAKFFEEREIATGSEKLMKLMNQLLVSDLPSKKPVKHLMKFVREFPGIRNLYFAKDREKLLKFFSENKYGR